MDLFRLENKDWVKRSSGYFALEARAGKYAKDSQLLAQTRA